MYTIYKVIKFTAMQYGIKDMTISRDGIGWVYYDGWEPIQEPETESMPYYIDDEINAIYELIEINQKTIDEYNILLSITFKESELLKIRKKIADLQLKNAKLENKVNKLLDKWEG